MPFNRPKRRKAEFIEPDMTLKKLVGYGGLAPDILEKAQALIEESHEDFIPVAEQQLTALHEGVMIAGMQKDKTDHEALISTMLYPAMQLKAHGGMFGYPVITTLANRLVQFLELVEDVNDDMLEIVSSFYTALNALVVSRIQNDETDEGEGLLSALNSACYRYFDKYN